MPLSSSQPAPATAPPRGAMADASPPGASSSSSATVIVVPPPPDLAPVVEYFWQLVLPRGEAHDAVWRVVVDGYVDLAVRVPLDPRLLRDAEGAPRSLAARRSVADALAAGPLVVCSAAVSARTLPLTVPLLVTGVRFRLGTVAPVLRHSLADLVDGARPLHDVLDTRGGHDARHALVAAAAEAAAAPATPADVSAEGDALRHLKRQGVVALVRRLVGRAAAARGAGAHADPRVRAALRLLDRAGDAAWAAPAMLPDHGEARIAATARALGVSPRTLERLFAEHVGFAPRTYQRVRRVGAVAEALERPPATRPAGVAVPAPRRPERPRTLSELAHTLGYTDHAHMTREFTRAMGVTPSRYRREALAAPLVRRFGAVAFERSTPFGTIGRAAPVTLADAHAEVDAEAV